MGSVCSVWCTHHVDRMQAFVSTSLLLAAVVSCNVVNCQKHKQRDFVNIWIQWCLVVYESKYRHKITSHLILRLR